MGPSQAIVLALLLPLAVVSAWFGPVVLIAAVLSALAAHAVDRGLQHARGLKTRSQLASAPTIAALLCVLSLPPSAPLWLPMLAAMLGVALGRHLLTRDGQALVNSAMLGVVLVLVWLPRTATDWSAPAFGDIATWQANLTAAFNWTPDFDQGAGVTPLDRWRTGLDLGLTLRDLQTTAPPGNQLAMALTIASLIGGLALLARGLIRWQIPVALLSGVCVASTALLAIDADRFASPWFHLTHGGVMLAAWFILSDPGSAPRGVRAIWWSGLIAGALIVLMRSFGEYADGVAFAVLAVNLLRPLLSRGEHAALGR